MSRCDDVRPRSRRSLASQSRRGLEAEIVDDEQRRVGQPAYLGLDGVVQSGGLEAFEQLVRAGRVRADAAAHRDARARWHNSLMVGTGLPCHL